ncbi:hypothetical protein XENORESO_009200 [Xenotaenia resolanae]|uniref:Succinate dehydrogenase subunit 4 n=1 Tax=Xenotaenia resolanae TaxID=208358 RepID=A0ABV0WE36_9TELE
MFSIVIPVCISLRIISTSVLVPKENETLRQDGGPSPTSTVRLKYLKHFDLLSLYLIPVFLPLLFRKLFLQNLSKHAVFLKCIYHRFHTMWDLETEPNLLVLQ